MAQRPTWPELLGAMISYRERLDRLSPDKGQPYTVPRVKASEDELVAYEAEVGESLPPAYRDFLHHADGWPGFYFRADLFGLSELRGGGNFAAARETLRIYDEQGVLDGLGIAVADIIPICAGPLDMGSTLFLLGRTGRPYAGQVFWLDGEVIDRYDDFREFVLAMLEYLRADVEKLHHSQPKN